MSGVEEKDRSVVGQRQLAAQRRKMQWTISVGLWVSYGLLLWAILVTGALGSWVAQAEWKEGPPALLFIVMPTALVLLTFEVWMGALRRRSGS